MINIKTGDMLSVAITQIEGYMPMDSSLSITLFLMTLSPFILTLSHLVDSS